MGLSPGHRDLGLICNPPAGAPASADIDGVIQLDRQLAPKGVKAPALRIQQGLLLLGPVRRAGGEVFGTDARGQPIRARPA